MLNRRSLRIKVMQSLFALQQCKEATYELSQEKISETFAPDLNSMQVQDKPLLQQQKKEAVEAQRFEEAGRLRDREKELLGEKETKEREIRKEALFWLAQSDDPAALRYLDGVLNEN